jgi:hypothetical protein
MAGYPIVLVGLKASLESCELTQCVPNYASQSAFAEQIAGFNGKHYL